MIVKVLLQLDEIDRLPDHIAPQAWVEEFRETFMEFRAKLQSKGIHVEMPVRVVEYKAPKEFKVVLKGFEE